MFINCVNYHPRRSFVISEAAGASALKSDKSILPDVVIAGGYAVVASDGPPPRYWGMAIL